MRMASTSVKLCQEDSSEFYLITGSIYTDQRGTVVFTTMSAARRGRVRFIVACSYSTDIHKDIMKDQITSIFYKFQPKGPGEGSGIALEVSDEPHLKGSNEEAGVTLEVPDRPGNDSSSSSSEISVEDISSDDDEVPVNDVDMSMLAKDATDIAVIAIDSVVEVIENDNTVTLTFENVKMTDVEMVIDQQVTGEQIPEQHNEAANVDAHIAPAREAQADVQTSDIQPDKLVNSSSHTFSST
ncbi:hypothetical protein Tco_0436013 [Tanacetum coccineum]